VVLIYYKSRGEVVPDKYKRKRVEFKLTPPKLTISDPIIETVGQSDTEISTVVTISPQKESGFNLYIL
jgi:hypothetical protein